MFSDPSPKLNDSDNNLLFKIAQLLSGGSASGPITQAAGDARYVLKVGDTMTGALNIATSANVPQLKITTSVGQSTQAFQIFQSDGTTQIFGVNFSGSTQIYRQSADTSGSSLTQLKRGTTGSATAAVAINDQLAQYTFQGWDGSAFVSGAQIQVTTRETFSGTARGSQFEFRAVIPTATALTLVATLNTTAFNVQGGAAYQLNGVALLNPLSVYAAGTVYTLTATSAGVDFGTTDPILTINAAGTYKIKGRVKVALNGATFAANRTLTVKLRRTNNTAADVASSSTTWIVPIVTTLTNTLAVIELPEVFYTTAVGTDTIQIFADISVLPSAGSISIDEASITAIRTS